MHPNIHYSGEKSPVRPKAKSQNNAAEEMSENTVTESENSIEQDLKINLEEEVEDEYDSEIQADESEGGHVIGGRRRKKKSTSRKLWQQVV